MPSRMGDHASCQTGWPPFSYWANIFNIFKNPLSFSFWGIEFSYLPLTMPDKCNRTKVDRLPPATAKG